MSLNLTTCNLLFFFAFIYIGFLCRPSTQESGFAFGSSRCLSICRRDEESLCKRCLFREPMRFGKRTFREPMRFGKKWDSENVKRKAFREPMRFGKREDIEASEMASSPLDLTKSGSIFDTSTIAWDNPIKQANLLLRAFQQNQSQPKPTPVADSTNEK